MELANSLLEFILTLCILFTCSCFHTHTHKHTKTLPTMPVCVCVYVLSPSRHFLAFPLIAPIGIYTPIITTSLVVVRVRKDIA